MLNNVKKDKKMRTKQNEKRSAKLVKRYAIDPKTGMVLLPTETKKG